jgi:hypothetical protein
MKEGKQFYFKKRTKKFCSWRGHQIGFVEQQWRAPERGSAEFFYGYVTFSPWPDNSTSV